MKLHPQINLSKASNILSSIANGIFFVLLTIILCGVVFIGNRLDYYDVCKITCLMDNSLLFLCGIVLIGLWLIAGMFLSRFPFGRICNLVTSLLLALAFVGLYFVGVEISKCIAFYSGWDMSVVTGSAYDLSAGGSIGDFFYYSVYPNNIPIAYYLGKLFTWARNQSDYAYNAEFVWIQTTNILISVAGFASCMTVKRITQRLFPVLTVFLLYVGCVFVTPWRIIPYTDMFAIAFPILCLCFYVYSRKATGKLPRYAFFTLACLSATLGGLLKPPVYILLITLILGELLHFLREVATYKKELFLKALLLVGICLLTVGYKNHIHTATGFIHNEAISATYHHYFLMGLNEESTGGYYSPDVAILGAFDSAKERTSHEMDLAWERIKEKGIIGYPYFLFKKMVMVFNDGTFGWGKEGGFFLGEYQHLTAAGYAQFLRDIFWPDFLYSGRFNTYSQLVWFVILAGVLCNLFHCKSKDSLLHTTLHVGLLGVILYLMLFEARARYLLCFLPLWIVVGTLGMDALCEHLQTWYRTKKKETNE
ncbi:MAG: hypothetical protein IJ335_05030 [Lachnospiraceae bacterium]|nr:hypothetical protein [Lachnospiraceae bacterium]